MVSVQQRTAFSKPIARWAGRKHGDRSLKWTLVVAGIQLMQTIQTSEEAHSGLVGSFAAAYRWGAVVGVFGVLCAAGLRRATRD